MAIPESTPVFDPSNAGPVWSILGPMVANLMGGGTQQAILPTATQAPDLFSTFIQSIIGNLVPNPQAQAAAASPPAVAPAGAGPSPSFIQQLLGNLGWFATAPTTNQAPNLMLPQSYQSAPQAWNIGTNAWVQNPYYQRPDTGMREGR